MVSRAARFWDPFLRRMCEVGYRQAPAAHRPPPRAQKVMDSGGATVKCVSKCGTPFEMVEAEHHFIAVVLFGVTERPICTFTTMLVEAKVTGSWVLLKLGISKGWFLFWVHSKQCQKRVPSKKEASMTSCCHLYKGDDMWHNHQHVIRKLVLATFQCHRGECRPLLIG